MEAFNWSRAEHLLERAARPAIRGFAIASSGGRAAAEEEQMVALLRAFASLQRVRLEPTTRNLARSSGLTRAQVDRLLDRARLDHLPAALFCQAIEIGERDEPDAIYLKSYVEPSVSPDKYGSDSLVPPNIDAARVLKRSGRARNIRAATASGYACAVSGGQGFAIGHVQLAQNWWRPATWAPHLAGTSFTLADVEHQLRMYGGPEVPVPFVDDPYTMASELLEQVVHVRDGAEWERAELDSAIVGSGWVRSGCTGELKDGFGARLEFISRDLTALDLISGQGFSPMLDLPQDPRARRERGGYPRTRWDLPWEFLVAGRIQTSDEVQDDLVALDGGESASRWWQEFDSTALRAVGIEPTGPRYRFVRLAARPLGANGRFRELTLIASMRRGRWSGWVDLRNPSSAPDGAHLAVQSDILRAAEDDIARHRRQGPVERTMRSLLDDGWAQRVKRRKFQERMNVAALAMSARTLLDLSRVV